MTDYESCTPDPEIAALAPQLTSAERERLRAILKREHAEARTAHGRWRLPRLRRQPPLPPADEMSEEERETRWAEFVGFLPQKIAAELVGLDEPPLRCATCGSRTTNGGYDCPVCGPATSETAVPVPPEDRLPLMQETHLRMILARHQSAAETQQQRWRDGERTTPS